MKTFAPALVLLLVFSCASVFAQSGGAPVAAGDLLGGKVEVRDDYNIVVNGAIVAPDVPPVEMNGVIFVPLRFIADALGARTDWDAGKKLVTISTAGGGELLLTVGDPEVSLNGAAKRLEAPPFIYQGRTMVPLKISAQAVGFSVEEKPGLMVITGAEKPKAVPIGEQKAEPEQGGSHSKDNWGKIVAQAKNDTTTKKIAPFVYILWALAGALWLVMLIKAFGSDEEGRFKDKILIGVILIVGVPLILVFMLSKPWAAAVAIITCIVGMISTEKYNDKLVTMGGTAQGAGLICTLLGLGLLIGPAIANRDIYAIGFGIAVKIEPTVTGLVISIIMGMLGGYEARRQR